MLVPPSSISAKKIVTKYMQSSCKDQGSTAYARQTAHRVRFVLTPWQTQAGTDRILFPECGFSGSILARKPLVLSLQLPRVELREKARVSGFGRDRMESKKNNKSEKILTGPDSVPELVSFDSTVQLNPATQGKNQSAFKGF